MITFRSDSIVQKRGYQLYFSFVPLGKYSENALLLLLLLSLLLLLLLLLLLFAVWKNCN